jgi:TonB family protein
MTAPLVLDNLLAWSAQVAVLVAIGALGALTLAHPRARLIFWQGVLAIALLLPAVEPWHQPAADEIGTVSIGTHAAQVVAAGPAAWHFSWKREYLLWVIAAVAALRILWIAAGLMRLRRHVRDARMMTIPPVPFSNPRVRWFISSTIGGPVTFGFLSPTILLPSRVAELPADLREAIAHHELAHVRRRDWLFVLLEESIRGLVWFHPAVWFVLSRIQLAREQVVDAEVVALTRDRERYLDALVAVAAQRLMPDVAPAPLFLKKRQLAVRVAAVLKENRMSKSRLFLSFTTVCSAALVAVRVAVFMFPLHAPAQTVVQAEPNYRTVFSDGSGVVVEPGAKILHRSPVFYPSGVSTSGTVIVESSVNAKGEVTDAHVVSGPEELRSAALSSVLTWHFSPDGGLPPTVQSSIRFETAPQRTGAPSPITPAPEAARTSYLKAINMNGLSDELAEKVSASLPVHVGDALGNEDFARVQVAVKEVDEHLMVGIRKSASDTSLTIMLRPAGAALPPDVTQAAKQANLRQMAQDIIASEVAKASSAELPPASTQSVRVGGNVQASNLIKKVTPVYPPDAKAARIQGMVRFTANIGKDGSVTSLEVVSGHPLLVQSAQDAVMQWMYKPLLLNGDPVAVVTQIDVNYTLSQ